LYFSPSLFLLFLSFSSTVPLLLFDFSISIHSLSFSLPHILCSFSFPIPSPSRFLFLLPQQTFTLFSSPSNFLQSQQQ
jgi:hypothetical protein